MSIVVKSSVGSDLRRFSIPKEISMATLVNLLSKLYALDISNFKIQYKDEDGDLVWLTTDMEVLEAVRYALACNPPILRLYISDQGVTQSVIGKSVVEEVASDIKKLRVDDNATHPVTHPKPQKKDIEEDWELTPSLVKPNPQEPPIHAQPTVVYVAGKAYYPSANPQPRVYGPAKVGSDESHQGPQVVTFRKEEDALQLSDVLRHPTVVSPVVVVVPPPAASQHRSLSALTTTIAESISNMVLESSAITHKNSCAVSDAVLRDTLIASQMTSEEVNSNDMHRAFSETRLVTNRETEFASSSVLLNAEATNVSVSPVSAQTRSLQDDATKGLNELVARGADAILNEILNL